MYKALTQTVDVNSNKTTTMMIIVYFMFNRLLMKVHSTLLPVRTIVRCSNCLMI